MGARLFAETKIWAVKIEFTGITGKSMLFRQSSVRPVTSQSIHQSRDLL